MPEDRLEEEVRRTLAAEVDAAGLSLSQLELRTRAATAESGRLPSVWAATGLATLVVAVAVAGFMLGRAQQAPTGSPPPALSASPSTAAVRSPKSTPSIAPTPSATPGPSLPADQSTGQVELWIDRGTPDEVHRTTSAVCQWSEGWPAGPPEPSGPRIVRVTGERVNVLGEWVAVTVSPFEDDSLVLSVSPYQDPPVRLDRQGLRDRYLRAPYAVRPGSDTIEGTGADDGSSGRLAYAEVGMASGVDTWPRPLGDDGGNERISLDVTWSCDRPDPGWDPKPFVQDEPPWRSLPALEATLRGSRGTDAVRSETACRPSLTMRDGSPGPAIQCTKAFGEFIPEILDVELGESLVLDAVAGWGLTSWSAASYPAEYFRDRLDPSLEPAHPAAPVGGGTADVGVGSVELQSPAEPGIHWIVIDTVLDGEDPIRTEITFAFRVRVHANPADLRLPGDVGDMVRCSDGTPFPIESLGETPNPGCGPEVWLGRFNPAQWGLLDDRMPQDDATSIELLVYEMSCASGRSSDGRVAVPQVVYEPDRLIITFGVLSSGDADCPGHPPSHYTIELREPLGDRRLFDGGVWPPREVRPGQVWP